LKIKLFLIFIMFLLGFFLLAIGCSKSEKMLQKGEQEKQAPAKEAKLQKAQKEEPKKEPVQVAYHYDATGKTDPFRPLVIEEPKSGGKRMARKVGSIPPLERYDLDQLKLVGVITNVKPPRALIEDVTGDGYIVTPGTIVGRNEGVIKEISENEIIVEEKTLDVSGKLNKKKSILKLHQPEELEEK
jgi:type IV pilus assembly protein PilP